MTRHGAGAFPTECDKALINPNMIDKTNQPNEFQETLRYGWLNVNSLNKRIADDLLYYNVPVREHIAVTQLNNTGGMIVSGMSQRSKVVSLAKEGRYIDCFSTEDI